MKPPTIPLPPRRVSRCKAIIKGVSSYTKIAVDQLGYLARNHPDRFLAMLTNEAVEELALYAIEKRASENRFNAKHRTAHEPQYAEVHQL